ncbi:MAG TPA: hypothetical protein VLA51_02945 [Paracoccaceae bacterium]|nr:hypothetical protein [Paracoccaceae bacterium]
MARLLTILTLLLTTNFAYAQDEAHSWMGSDAFHAGNVVSHTESGADDLFMAGETLRVLTGITGTAHLAGRRLEVDAPIGADIYAAGMEIDITAPVTGDVTAAGYDINILNDVGGDIRATAARITVNGPVAGTASLSGDILTVNGVIGGDVALAGREYIFGPDARINGQLLVYSNDPDSVGIPDAVISAANVEIREVEEWSNDGVQMMQPPWYTIILSVITGVIVVALVGMFMALVAPSAIARLRTNALAHPLRALWFGFLTLSAIAGSTLVFAMTIIGIFVAPAMIIIGLCVGLLGYVLGAYILGVGAMIAVGRPQPENFGQRAIAAIVGATIAGLIVLIPLLGWIFAMALALVGTGALTITVLRPAFFVAAQPQPQ